MCGRLSVMPSCARNLCDRGWFIICSLISIAEGVEGTKRVSVSASVGGFMKPLTASAIGAAAMATPVLKKTNTRVEVKNIRRNLEGLGGVEGEGVV